MKPSGESKKVSRFFALCCPSVTHSLQSLTHSLVRTDGSSRLVCLCLFRVVKVAANKNAFYFSLASDDKERLLRDILGTHGFLFFFILCLGEVSE